MFKSSRLYLILFLIALPVVFGGTYLSLSLRDEELLVATEPVPSPAVLPVTIKNASYSALPSISGKVASQRAPLSSQVTDQGDNLLVLVNKSIGLPSSYYPKDLVSLDGKVLNFGGGQLRKGAADKLVQMFAAAKKAGYNLTVTSAYRSYATQQTTYNYWVSTAGATAASQISARPGHSQHQLGTAVDLSSTAISNNLSPNFGKTPEGKWLAVNAYRWGYVLSYPAGKEQITGYAYEPWHFRYIGTSAAGQMRSLGLDLETYLQNYGVW
jgi:D-alanyl-D-alanine carboxypeptidase